ncbi:hypothetical protein R9C00_14750 [Flammeovirgaceae bacterium SG7u.111]|nr:hypothetical protein [Flammeovirgaceae bacterium SG7u.132]WPO38718.1 hypothetical protein R9C00_14750 [Flammeovirgaceae bacterium SG7u.111]
MMLKYIFLLLGGLSIASAKGQLYEQEIDNRADILLEQVANKYRLPNQSAASIERYFWSKVIARFEQYGEEDKAGNEWVAARVGDYPKQISLVGMARLLSKYPTAPSLKKNKVKLLKKVFERRDSYNAWMGEGTESEVSMSRTSGYILAQEAMAFPDVFPQAEGKLEQMEGWMKSWAEQLLTYGAGEWNSGKYGGYSLIGWLNVYDFAKSEEIKKIAKAVLDYYAAEMALHYSYGAYGGAEMRGNGVGKIDDGAIAYFCWFWFSEGGSPPLQGWLGSEYVHVVHAATSSYRPPSQLLSIAKKNIGITKLYQGAKPSYLFEERGFVNQQFYVGQGFTLGSAQSPYGGWTEASSELVNWKLVVKKEGAMPDVVSGNGRFYNDWSGKTRNPWTQHFQYKNILVQLTQTPYEGDHIVLEMRDMVKKWAKKWGRDFKSRYPHETNKEDAVSFGGKVINKNTSYINLPRTEIKMVGPALYVGLENAWLLISFVHSSPHVKIMEKGKRFVYVDEAEAGLLCGFVMEAFEKNRFASLQEFTQNAKAQLVQKDEHTILYETQDREKIEVTFGVDGTFIEPMVDGGWGVQVPVVMATAPPFEQPEWPKGEHHGRIPKAKVNGKKVSFKKKAPIYQGDDIWIENGKIRLGSGADIFEGGLE